MRVRKDENEIIAHNIRLLRKKDDLTQKDFGNKYKVNQRSIDVYESAYIKPKPDFLLALSKGSGLSPEVLLNVKLKMTNGVFTNIPSQQKEFQKVRQELNAITKGFQNDINGFFKKLHLLNERLDKIESRLKK
jgi:transcriptional regulator with XRE-family HTH domain